MPTYRPILNGESPWDSLGYTVSGAGDLNNDGFDDVLVEADERHLGSGDRNSGCVYILLVSAIPSSPINAANADSRIEGTTRDEYFGFFISTVGDLNNDGFDDFIAGAHGNDDAGSNAGCAYVFYGKSNLTSVMYPSNADVIIYGANGNDFFGRSVGGSK